MEFILDMHCHTVASGHAYSTVKECIDEAVIKGLELIAITDHAPGLPGSVGAFHFWNLHVIPQFLNGVEILKGAELSILGADGSVDLPPEYLKKLDLVIASLHPPCLMPMSKEENTEAVINVMKNPYVHVIGHLGDPRYDMDLEQVLNAAKQTNTLIELNNSSLEPLNGRAGGEHIIKQIMSMCWEREMPIVLGSDAHFYTEVGNFKYARKLLDELSFPESLILNTSKQLFLNALEQKSKSNLCK